MFIEHGRNQRAARLLNLPRMSLLVSNDFVIHISIIEPDPATKKGKGKAKSGGTAKGKGKETDKRKAKGKGKAKAML
jgi:hypothetical protein